MQRGDFVGIFRAMDGLPVTIRLLDPPLHEFLPHGDAEIDEVAEALGTRRRDGAREGRASCSESNPMLGHRGCRLGITYPEIYEMQVRAIVEAACEVAERARSRAARDHDPAGRAPRASSRGCASLRRGRGRGGAARVRRALACIQRSAR